MCQYVDIFLIKCHDIVPALLLLAPPPRPHLVGLRQLLVDGVPVGGLKRKENSKI